MRASILCVALAACGGGSSRGGAVEPSGDGDVEPGGGDAMPDEATLDEIQAALERKRIPVSRCLSDAIEAGDVPKSTGRVKMTVGFTIGTDGAARDVAITETSLDNATVMKCVEATVGEIEFPRLEQPLPWTFQYLFQA